MADNRTAEEILLGIADDLRPEVDRAVAELGREQVIANIDNSLARTEVNRIKRIADRLNMTDKTPDEARVAIKYVLDYYPAKSRFIYPALANKAWLLMHYPYTDEVRDWHVLIRATQALIGDTDPTTVERLNVLADLLGESVSQAEIGPHRGAAGDAQPEPSS